jgi:class 3 adenylate cyclase
VARLRKRNLSQPTDTRTFGRGRLDLVDLGDIAVGRTNYEPGWQWSKDVKPIVGTEVCEMHHVGYFVSGRLHTEMSGGSSIEIRPGDVFELPPGHDAWVVGDEPWVSIDWSGRRFYGIAASSTATAVLTTIMFTDIVGSTELATKLGDNEWRERLAEYHALVRRSLERHHGREIQTTGDSILATFDGPARGVQCALELARATPDLALAQRAGLHTGEIEMHGDDVRGVAVHLAARVAAAAGPGEVLVSPTTNALLFGSGLNTISRGNHSLKGIEQPVELFAVGESAG